ncbi:hypothetical protein [Loktanella gaetbuli]|nr:hypothetical protein [Loktanella gaetbuli]
MTKIILTVAALAALTACAQNVPTGNGTVVTPTPIMTEPAMNKL